MKAKSEKVAEPVSASPATVQRHGSWHLVTYGSWQISVDPAGVIMLPRHLHPREVDDFVGCMAVAKDVALTVVSTNERATAVAATRPGGRSSSAVVITQGPPPPGLQRIPTQQRTATIGRVKSRTSK